MSRLRELGRRIALRRRARRLMGPQLLSAFADQYPRATFVEIGANDGVDYDHLRRLVVEHEWRGIMVEPVPHLFKRLRSNYAGIERVTPVNAAIADHDGRLTFYHPPEGDFDMIGSLSRESTLRVGAALGFTELEGRIVATEVDCLSFNSLCQAQGIENLDLLVIDTEGYDFEILKQVDFATWRPRLLVYEHGLLPTSERRECRALVEGRGYEAKEEGFDTWCLDTAEDDGLTGAWRELEPGDPGTSAEELGWVPESDGGPR